MTAEVSPIRTHLPKPNDRFFPSQTRRQRLASGAWLVVSRTLFRWSPPRCDGWRRWLLRWFGAQVASDARIDPSVVVRFPWNLRLGADTCIDHNVVLDCIGPIEIREGTRISQYTMLCSGTHEYERSDMRVRSHQITIGRDVWLAADVFVGPNVHVGDRTIVGARSGIFRDLPPDVVAVGSSAKPLKPREGEPNSTGSSRGTAE